MTDVICGMEECIHRSKKPMRKYKYNDGRKCYKCTLEIVQIKDKGCQETDELLDERLPCCNKYEVKENSKQ